jgi:hypothetical protein
MLDVFGVHQVGVLVRQLVQNMQVLSANRLSKGGSHRPSMLTWGAELLASEGPPTVRQSRVLPPRGPEGRPAGEHREEREPGSQAARKRAPRGAT